MPTSAIPVAPVDLKVTLHNELWLSPNDFLRSALFGIFKRDRSMLKPGESLVLHDYPTFSLTLWGGPPSDIEGPYGTATQTVSGAFDQFDHDVLMCLLHESEGVVGVPKVFHTYELLEKLGKKGRGAANAQVLHNSLARMSRTLVVMRFKPNGALHFISYSGTLISTVYDGNTGTYSVAIDGNLGTLMTAKNYSGLLWKERLALTSPLSKWLHGFFSTHAEPEPVEITTLHTRTGSRATLKEFRRTLKEALTDLSTHTEMYGDIDGNDRVMMCRGRVSKTQKRAVVRNSLAGKRK